MRVSHSGLAAGVVAALIFATAPTTSVAAVAPAATDRPVLPIPASWTPTVYEDDLPVNQDPADDIQGPVEKIRQLVPCGDMMYAVGRFTKIKQGATIHSRNNAFSFNATTGEVSSWDPNVTVSGIDLQVSSVALSADCSTAYLGGQFKSVGPPAANPGAGARPATNLVSVSTSTGLINPLFGKTADGRVSALVRVGERLLVGGFFSVINGTTRPHLASMDLVNGTVDDYVNLDISGEYTYTDAEGKTPTPPVLPNRVYNFSLNPDETKLLAMGIFTSVAGQPRQQIFMLDLGATQATLNEWYSPGFNEYCDVTQPYWLQDASWAPDGSKIYIATTGFRPATGDAHDNTKPRAGLCDAAAAYPTTPSGDLSPLWVSYTGCDSLYSTAADSTTVYVGGHHRWMNNPKACGGKGPGAIDAPGLAGLSPSTGGVSLNPTRGRGEGAQDMLVTSAGLWIGSDNNLNTHHCGGVPNRAGICFMPYGRGLGKPKADFDDDGRADRITWRPATGMWAGAGSVSTQYGQNGDVPLAGNFAGDTTSDRAVWRPSKGTWYVQNQAGVVHGVSSDKPVAADYNNDGLSDFAVWRPSNGNWYIRSQPTVQWGQNGDRPLVGDFINNGATDPAVWRPSNGNWYVKSQPAVQLGLSTDMPVLGDFDGNGKADYAVWRPSNGNWYIKSSPTAAFTTTQWGAPTDIPVAGDFNGDNKTDIAVWRPSNGTWYVFGLSGVKQGQSGDVPLPSG